MYCEFCEGPVRDEEEFSVLRDSATDYYFCNEKELRDWLEDNPDRSADIIMNDPELVEVMGW